MEESLNIKYLYGTKIGLGRVLKPNGKVRFRDSRYYRNHENESIKDDECNRVFKYEGKQIQSLQFGPHIIPGSDIKYINVSVPVQVCHLLCLSNTGNSSRLFERFKANICLAIDVGRLVEIMSNGFLDAKLHGQRIVHKPIKYFSAQSDLDGADPESLVFHKDSRFSEEDEYRIAVFWPYHAKTILTNENARLIIFGKSVKNILQIGMAEPEGIRTVVIQAKDREGKTLFARPE